MVIGDIINIAMLVIMLFVILWFIISMVMLSRLYIRFNNNTHELIALKESNKEKLVDYSNKSLDFIKMMISQTALLKFRTFIDANDISKVTRIQIEGVVSDVAKTVKGTINMNNIAIENTIYTEEFFDNYIIETSVYIVKQLFENAVDKSIADK